MSNIGYTEFPTDERGCIISEIYDTEEFYMSELANISKDMIDDYKYIRDPSLRLKAWRILYCIKGIEVCRLRNELEKQRMTNK